MITHRLFDWSKRASHLLGAAKVMTITVGVSVAAFMNASGANAQDVLRIAAVVNDKVISVRDLAARTHFIVISSDLPNTPQTHRRLWPRVLDGLIDETLKLEEAERFGIEVSERDLDNAKSILERRNKIPTGSFESFLRQQGIDIESALNQMRAEIAWSKLVRQRFSRVATVGEDEVQDVISRFEENVGKPQSRVQEILLRVEDPTRENEVRGLAARIVEQLRGGGNFSALAREFSQSATAATGGDVGWVSDGQLSRELDTTLQTLEPNQISDPVRTLFGYHIIRMAGRRILAASNPLDATVELKQVFLPIPAGSSQAEADNQITLAGSVRESAEACVDMDRLATEVDSPVPADLGTLKIGELAPPFRDAVRGLAVGVASEPVKLPTGVSIVMICSKEEAPSNLPSAEDVRRQLQTQRFDSLSQRLLRDLRRSAFIDTRV